jgi:multidrug transporter EmrE-like cation transporter
VFLLDERVAPMQIVGIVVVIAGVWCVSMTKRATLGSGAEPE